MTATVSFTIDSPLGPRPTTIAYERKGAGEPFSCCTASAITSRPGTRSSTSWPPSTT